MKSNIFFKTTGCLLIAALLFIPVISADTDSLNLIRNDKGNMVYHDSHAGKTWEGPPPPSELLEGKPHWKKLELLDNWTTQVRSNDKELYRKYFECKNELDRLEQELPQLEKEKLHSQKEKDKHRIALQKMLLKAMTNLGLQTSLILADGITDIYLTGKAFKDSIAQDQKDIKGSRAKAEMIAEAEKLTRKAAAGRRLAAEALAKLEEAQRQLALTRAAKDDAVTTQKGGKKPSAELDSGSPSPPKQITSGLNFTDREKKLMQHAHDWGIGTKGAVPSGAVGKMKKIANHIHSHATHIKQGPWHNIPDAVFYSNGKHLVVTRTDGNLITILKNAQQNKYFRQAKDIWKK